MRNGLKLQPIQDGHWYVGSGKATERFGGVPLNPSGNWSSYKAPDKHQSNGSFDTECCWIFSTLKPYIMLAKLLGFQDFPQTCSERYLAVEAHATPFGGDPLVAAETNRKVGVIPDAILPFTSDIRDFPDFDSPNPMDEVIESLGKASLNKWVFGYEWIFAYGNTYTPEQKQQMIADAAKRGSVAYSVDGNYQRNSSGQLTKPVGGRDSHWVTHLNINSDGSKTFHDQYDPFLEIVEPNYDHNAAILYFLARNDNPQPRPGKWASFAAKIWAMFAKLWGG